MRPDFLEVRDSRRSLDRVDGDLRVENAEIVAQGGSLRVSGGTECRGHCDFLGNVSTGNLEGIRGDVIVRGDLEATKFVDVKGGLEVTGSLKSERLEVKRSATVGGALDVGDVDVGGSLDVAGEARADKVSVGGSLHCASGVDFGRMDVGGTADVRGATRSERIEVGGAFRGGDRVVSADVDVGGSFEAEGEVEIGKIDVGGTARVGGGRVDRKVDVGGTFRSTAPLKFNTIDVGGTVNLTGGTGEDIDVGGRLVSEGSLTFNRIRVGGAVEINGDAVGSRVDVGGTFSAAGDVRLSDRLRVGGRIEVKGSIEAESVSVGGSVTADAIRAKGDIEASRLRTAKGAKGDRIEIRRRGEARGPLVGREVIVKEGAEVEDVWGESVTLLRGARARRVYASILYAEAGSDVTDAILFSGELRAERGCRFTAQPAKAEKLLDPPI